MYCEVSLALSASPSGVTKYLSRLRCMRVALTYPFSISRLMYQLTLPTATPNWAARPVWVVSGLSSPELPAQPVPLSLYPLVVPLQTIHLLEQFTN